METLIDYLNAIMYLIGFIFVMGFIAGLALTLVQEFIWWVQSKRRHRVRANIKKNGGSI